MDEVDKILGIDDTSPIMRLARQLVNDRTAMHEALVDIRENAGLTPEVVAYRVGCPVATIREFERYDGMDTARRTFIDRYAHAIGARITTTVEADYFYPGDDT